MAYYTSETCGYVNGSYVTSVCIKDYSRSDIKYIVDAWVTVNTNLNDLVVDSTGYKARLITKSEYILIGSHNVWRYNSNYWYWTMNPHDLWNYIWSVRHDGAFNNYTNIYNFAGTVRPVITLSKLAL